MKIINRNDTLSKLKYISSQTPPHTYKQWSADHVLNNRKETSKGNFLKKIDKPSKVRYMNL